MLARLEECNLRVRLRIVALMRSSERSSSFELESAIRPKLAPMLCISRHYVYRIRRSAVIGRFGNCHQVGTPQKQPRGTAALTTRMRSRALHPLPCHPRLFQKPSRIASAPFTDFLQRGKSDVRKAHSAVRTGSGDAEVRRRSWMRLE